MAKTLVVALADGTFVLCVMPGTVELSVKKLAREAGAKSGAHGHSDSEADRSGYPYGNGCADGSSDAR